MILTELMTVSQNVVSMSADSGGDGQALKLIFLLSGPAYFAFMYARYRNRGARHKHERETEAQVTNLTGNDQKVRRITGTSSSSLSGANATKIRGSRNKNTLF